MTTLDLQDKLVAIVGFGQKEGKATAEYLLKHGISPVLFDHKPWHDWNEEDQEYIKALKVNFIFGSDCLTELKNFDVAFRNPSVPRLHPVLLQREREGLIITSQTKWFFEHCPGDVIGVTGTKGKGTTCSLIYEILSSSPSQNSSVTYLTGNLGFIQPFEILDNLKSTDKIVYELSSFQLQDLTISPHIGVVLMVTSEHLDHHKDVHDYREAKEAIVKFQDASDTAIFNKDYPATKKIGELSAGKKLFVSTINAVNPGCYVENGNIVAINIFDPITIVVPVANVKLRGYHNLENICAAVLAASAAGSSLEAIRSTLKIFKGLEHRLEFVGEKKGISFYDDSFSTVPETAIAALKSFTEPVVHILGGSTKKSDFIELVSSIVASSNSKAVITIGDEGVIIEKLLKEAGYKGLLLSGAVTMKEIFNQVEGIAQSGDVVLLSPAAASFGLFKNYKDRGNQFKEQVLLWANEKNDTVR